MTTIRTPVPHTHQILGLMGLRSGEARSLAVGALDPATMTLNAANSGSGRSRTNPRAGMRKVPVPASVLPGMVTLAADRPRGAYLFQSRRKPGQPVDKGYVTDALTRAIGRANERRSHPIVRIKVHELRHTFAAIALPEPQADVLSVRRALG